MLIIKIGEGENIEKALKRFKRKFNDTQLVKQLREREQFTKNSTTRRNEIKKAIYRRKLLDKLNKNE